MDITTYRTITPMFVGIWGLFDCGEIYPLMTGVAPPPSSLPSYAELVYNFCIATLCGGYIYI
jgi:hypothetical protein